ATRVLGKELHDPKLPEADEFGPFRLGAIVGEGGMAEVRVAFERARPELGPIVIKRLKAANDLEMRMMFADEARLALGLDHPNLVRAFSSGEIDGFPYIVFELLEGVSLREMAGTVPSIPIPIALEIAEGVLSALDYAHRLHGDDGRSLSLVHRDVSPENILI